MSNPQTSRAWRSSGWRGEGRRSAVAGKGNSSAVKHGPPRRSERGRANSGYPALEWERPCTSADRRLVILSGPQAAFRLRDEAAPSAQCSYGDNAMLSHIMLRSNDIDRPRKFYDSLLARMGAQPAVDA